VSKFDKCMKWWLAGLLLIFGASHPMFLFNIIGWNVNIGCSVSVIVFVSGLFCAYKAYKIAETV
jgi:hypothetical protein